MTNTSINATSDGYRRGVIFGLTMAEVLLLLIFCLLLFLKNINDQLKIAETRLSELESSEARQELVKIKLVDANKQRDLAISEIKKLTGAFKDTVSLDEFDILTTKLADAEKQRDKAISKMLQPDVTVSRRHQLSAQVKLKDLELLAEGKMEVAGNNWPPIISLADAENFSFEVGSANLTKKFKADLNAGIADQIYKTLQKYNADVIEVIGHTDLQRMNQRMNTSNLDDQSLKFFQSINSVELSAKDNAGLGFARALSVTKELSKVSKLDGYTILPYSAAQLITPNESINIGENEFESSELRRIEIRVRRKIKKKN